MFSFTLCIYSDFSNYDCMECNDRHARNGEIQEEFPRGCEAIQLREKNKRQTWISRFVFTAGYYRVPLLADQGVVTCTTPPMTAGAAVTTGMSPISAADVVVPVGTGSTGSAKARLAHCDGVGFMVPSISWALDL